jgi:hypothetical protein
VSLSGIVWSKRSPFGFGERTLRHSFYSRQPKLLSTQQAQFPYYLVPPARTVSF